MHALIEKFVDAFKARTDLYDKITRGNDNKSSRDRINLLFTKGQVSYSLTLEVIVFLSTFLFILKKQEHNSILSRTVVLDLSERYHSTTHDELVSEILGAMEHQMIYHQELRSRFNSIHKHREGSK